MRVTSFTRFRVAARLIIFGASLFMAETAGAQQQPTCQPWISQSSWSGTITLQGGGKVVRSDGSTVKIDESATIAFTTDNSPDGCFSPDPLIWVASRNAVTSYSVNINDEVDIPCGVGMQIVNTYQVANGTALIKQAELEIDPSAGTYLVTMITDVDGLQDVGTLCDGSKSHSFTDNEWSFGPNKTSLASGIRLPNSGLALSGSVTYQAPAAVLELFADPSMSWTITWNLTPTPRTFDLLVAIPNYQTWRPAGGINEKDVGVDPSTGLRLLEIDAKLIDKNTGAQSAITPEKITFSLVDPSREPGVTMNWPAKDVATSDPDITFDDLVNPLAILSSEDTVADFVPADSSPTTAYVVSHDWGGWATLNVVATVNGEKINGHFQADTTTNILLPKRQVGSFIADSWKTAQGLALSTSDADDSENNPSGDPALAGDGLTLYEEYRGFYAACPACSGGLLHVEGDVKKKDLFVVNIGRPELKRGVQLFKNGSGVATHFVTMDQISPDHVINFNTNQGPHEVDQHAVVMGDGTSGARACTSTTTGNPGTPKVVKEIFIPPTVDFNKYAILVQLFGVVPADPSRRLDSLVAHELGHSVSIWHHGSEDGPNPTAWWYSPDGTSISEIGKGSSQAEATVIQGSGGGTPIHVFTEKPRELTAKDLTILSRLDLVPVIQGVNGGEHSGDVRCFMRYDNSFTYVANGDSTRRYLASEFPGSSLTNNASGTGTNLPGRSPQSRYGSASAGLGECSRQLCVNDKLTPPDRGPSGSDCGSEQTQN